MKMHHVGYACQSIEKEKIELMNQGFVPDSEVFEDPQQKIRGIFMLNQGHRIELLEPLGSPSPIDHFIQKGLKMYHMGFLVPSIEEAINEMSKEKAMVISKFASSTYFGGPIAFLMTKNKSIVELIQMTEKVKI